MQNKQILAVSPVASPDTATFTVCAPKVTAKGFNKTDK